MEYNGCMATAAERSYTGQELELFALATNWKRYVKAQIGKYLIGDVLEIGAGIGGATLALHDGTAHRWICLEPDAAQAERLRATVIKNRRGCKPGVIAGSLRTLADRPSFDCVLYLDVLEHIQDDRLQIEEAARRVRTWCDRGIIAHARGPALFRLRAVPRCSRAHSRRPATNRGGRTPGSAGWTHRSIVSRSPVALQ